MRPHLSTTLHSHSADTCPGILQGLLIVDSGDYSHTLRFKWRASCDYSSLLPHHHYLWGRMDTFSQETDSLMHASVAVITWIQTVGRELILFGDDARVGSVEEEEVVKV